MRGPEGAWAAAGVAVLSLVFAATVEAAPAPVITEPAADAQYVHPADVHMEVAPRPSAAVVSQRSSGYHAFVTESGPTYATGPQTRGKRIVEFDPDPFTG